MEQKNFTTSISFYHKYNMLNSIIEKLFLHRKDFTFFAWESYVLSWVEKLVVTNLPFYTLILSVHMCLIRKSSSCSVSFSLASKIWLSKYVVIEGIYDNIINPLRESICYCRFMHRNSINMHFDFIKVFLWDFDCIVSGGNEKKFIPKWVA